MSVKTMATGLVAAAGILTLGLSGPAIASSPDSGHVAGHSAAIKKGGKNVTVTKGAYKATFRNHDGSKGETLEVFDDATDGHAAVAYVHMWADPGPIGPPELEDKDRLVVKNGYHKFNLREGDSGPYDIPEGHEVDVMICKGYASEPGDNCSDWKQGVA